MSHVIAYKEPSWMDPNTDFRLWENITRAYGLGLTLLDPDDELSLADSDVVVVVDERGEIDIKDFRHPDECVYVFGRTHQNDLMKMPHTHSVRIDYEGKNCLFGCEAAAIVLHERDRYLKT